MKLALGSERRCAGCAPLPFPRCLPPVASDWVARTPLRPVMNVHADAAGELGPTLALSISRPRLRQSSVSRRAKQHLISTPIRPTSDSLTVESMNLATIGKIGRLAADPKIG